MAQAACTLRSSCQCGSRLMHSRQYSMYWDEPLTYVCMHGLSAKWPPGILPFLGYIGMAPSACCARVQLQGEFCNVSQLSAGPDRGQHHSLTLLSAGQDLNSQDRGADRGLMTATKPRIEAEVLHVRSQHHYLGLVNSDDAMLAPGTENGFEYTCAHVRLLWIRQIWRQHTGNALPSCCVLHL